MGAKITLDPIHVPSLRRIFLQIPPEQLLCPRPQHSGQLRLSQPLFPAQTANDLARGIHKIASLKKAYRIFCCATNAS